MSDHPRPTAAERRAVAAGHTLTAGEYADATPDEPAHYVRPTHARIIYGERIA